jgi:hypothetical protein
MASIEAQVNIIKDILKTQDKELIINTIKDINPIILMYYQMIDNTFEYYTDKLPEEYFNFDIDNAIQMFIDIDDIDFVFYIIKEFDLHINSDKGQQIMDEMIEYYIENDEIDNLNIIHQKSKCLHSNSFHTFKTVYDYCCRNNKHQIFEMFIMNPDNNDEDDAEPDDFNHTMCCPLMTYGDYVDIIKVLYKYSKEYPAFLNFDFNLIFNAAIIQGRYKCMQYCLDNSTIEYHYEEEKYSFPVETVNVIYPMTDSIMYAIIGKNMNCVRTVFDMFKNKLNDSNWEHYFKFASVYGTLEIIQYMIMIKPYLVDQIEGFYNNILKFALCEGNIEIVRFAIINGANYSSNRDDMIKFIKDYNEGRGPEYIGIDEDYSGFYDEKYHCPKNLDERIMECMRFIYN